MYLAIDIGGTKTLIAALNHEGEIVHSYKMPTSKSYNKFVQTLESALNHEFKDYHFGYICCAAPALIDHEDGIAKSFGNLPWHNAELEKDLSKMLGHVPVVIENDAKLAGLGEAVLVHKEYKKVLYLTISTGIGGSVIIDGKIDHTLIDVEPGQMMLEHDGKIQRWEDFASGRALHERTGKLASEIDDPKVWQDYAKDLAPGIEQLVTVIHPEVIIVGGGLGAHFEKLSAPLHDELKKLESAMVRIPPVIKAKHPEEAVIHGCYELIKQSH